MVIVFPWGGQLTGFASNTAVQVKVLLSGGIAFDIFNILLLLMTVPLELVQFTVIPNNDKRFTHCMVSLYSSSTCMWYNGTVGCQCNITVTHV